MGIDNSNHNQVAVVDHPWNWVHRSNGNNRKVGRDMTLYRALLNTQFTDYGWDIEFPDGTSENYEFIGIALSDILMEKPEMLTAEVTKMEYHKTEPDANGCDYFKVYLDYGKDYRGDMSGILNGHGNKVEISEVFRLLGYAGRMADDFTLGEINRVADIAQVMPNEVLNYLGF